MSMVDVVIKNIVKNVNYLANYLVIGLSVSVGL